VSSLPRYTLRRSARSRGLRITIDPLRGLIVSVPPATRRGWAHPEPQIERFIREREAWIRRHLDRHAAQAAALATRGGLRDGGRVPFRGELHELAIEAAPAGASRSTVSRRLIVEGDHPLIVVALAARDRRPVRTVLEAWLRDEARAAIDAEIVRHASALGVRPAAVSFRDQRSRWGSASRQGRLSFSWRLILAPPEALETVVIHELAHLRVFGHGPAFWALVASRRADHLVWRRWLRAHSMELHSALDEPSEEVVRETA
jgi:predicted metal-dependent hydrolase